MSEASGVHDDPILIVSGDEYEHEESDVEEIGPATTGVKVEVAAEEESDEPICTYCRFVVLSSIRLFSPFPLEDHLRE